MVAYSGILTGLTKSTDHPSKRPCSALKVLIVLRAERKTGGACSQHAASAPTVDPTSSSFHIPQQEPRLGGDKLPNKAEQGILGSIRV